MRDVFGIIFTGENDSNLKELTRSRSIAAIPMWGRYRGIDTLLSKMVNSDIRNVGVITQRNYRSLMDHLVGGKEWDLNRKRDGLFILPPVTTVSNEASSYRGLVDALHSNFDYIRRSSQKYALVTTSHIFYSAEYDAMFEAHLDRDADITIMYNKVPTNQLSQLSDNVHLQVHDNGQVWDMELRPNNPKSNNVFMDAMLMEKTLLEYLVEECFNRGKYDMTMDVLLPATQNLKVFGYQFDGYAAHIESIQGYFKHNLAILDGALRDLIFNPDYPIYTKVKDEVPSYYGPVAQIENVLAGSGCVIDGDVTESVLFRGVRVGANARVKNCVIMQGAEVQEGAQLENVIVDKAAIIRRGVRLIGTPSYPSVVPKGMVI